MTGNSSTAQPSVLRIQAVLIAIALTAGLAIATVHELTRPMVMAQRGGLLGDAALEVMPGAESYRIYVRQSDGSLRLLGDGDTPELFIGLDGDARAVGAALVASGMGYADTIQLVYGLAPDERRLTGMRVVSSRETPGLGSRIIDDEDFVEGFTRIELPFDNGALQPLKVRDGAVHEQGEIDAMSGATVSVDAVADIINQSLAEWLDLLDARYDELAGDGRG
jgi:electron transport complex protein RnfG